MNPQILGPQGAPERHPGMLCFQIQICSSFSSRPHFTPLLSPARTTPKTPTIKRVSAKNRGLEIRVIGDQVLTRKSTGQETRKILNLFHPHFVDGETEAN